MQDVNSRNLVPPRFSDVWLMGVAFLLVVFGVVMIYSTTGIMAGEKLGDNLYYVKKQTAAAVIGCLLMYFFSRFDVEILRRYSGILLPASLFLLIATLMPGIGDAGGGAQRWIKLGPVRFQPGEFVKLFFIIYMAGYYARHEGRLAFFTDGICKPVAFIGLIGALLLAQPDFGSTAIIAGVALCMGAAAGMSLFYLAIGGGFMASALAVMVIISPYRLGRIMSFLSPWSDSSGKGYQLIQSLIAVGTGQAAGVGLGASKQKLFFLPAAHTDFIFAVISEELGFIGGVVLILAFLFLMYRGLRIAARVADDTFAFSLAVGMTMLIALPALLNVGVVTGLLPTKGMVLPLVGYGGSSLIACLAGIGILLSIARNSSRG